MIPIEPPSTSCMFIAASSRRMRTGCRLCAFVWIGALAICASDARAQMETVKVGAPAGWQLVWADEFDGAAGAGPDPAKWTFDLGSGPGNHELETYTSARANVEQRDGRLVVTAIKEAKTGEEKVEGEKVSGEKIAGMERKAGAADAKAAEPVYTSGRIKTQGLFAQTYGRFEARMRLPLGKGIWPAFWLLGGDIATVGWPQCGEIDVMENIGEPGVSHSTLHGPGYSGGKAVTAQYALPAGEALDTSFHVYAVVWAPNDIRFLLDEELVAERTPADLPAGTKWVFDHPFFIILNLAVGGDWPGYPDATTRFPQTMLVDYVRVYTRTP